MTKGIYPGSFDPVTFGHLDIIKRSAKMVDELIIGVLNNGAKGNALFTAEERVKLLQEVTSDIPNVTVKSFNGLLVDFAARENARMIIRGLRAITDFEYELQMSQTNRVINHEIDTIFLTTSLEYAYLSSSTVKEVAAFGGKIDEFVPSCVAKQLHEKFL